MSIHPSYWNMNIGSNFYLSTSIIIMIDPLVPCYHYAMLISQLIAFSPPCTSILGAFLVPCWSLVSLLMILPCLDDLGLLWWCEWKYVAIISINSSLGDSSTSGSLEFGSYVWPSRGSCLDASIEFVIQPQIVHLMYLLVCN